MIDVVSHSLVLDDPHWDAGIREVHLIEVEDDLLTLLAIDYLVHGLGLDLAARLGFEPRSIGFRDRRNDRYTTEPGFHAATLSFSARGRPLVTFRVISLEMKAIAVS